MGWTRGENLRWRESGSWNRIERERGKTGILHDLLLNIYLL